MADVNNPEESVTEIISNIPDGFFNETTIKKTLSGFFVQLELKSTNTENSKTINAICGLLFQRLKVQANISSHVAFNVMQVIFDQLADPATAITTSNISTFFSYFCKFYNSGCSCFNDFTLKVLKNKNFDLSFKTKEGSKNLGIALGINAKIQELPIEQCIKIPSQMVKGYALGYAFKEFFNLTQADFPTTCENYFDLDLRVKSVSRAIKNMIDEKILDDSTENLTDVFCGILLAWEDSQFAFCAKSLADFLMIRTQISRDQFEDLKIQVYSCLQVPALRNVYLKIGSCTEIDLSRFVMNDSTAFKYTINSTNTKGRIVLSTAHPPSPPLVRYKAPQNIDQDHNFKDSFEFTVENTTNNYISTATVFLTLDL